ncbi:hypothetical protein BKA64DRAFT_708562 [Cadophora sp. MPI-SDFR-AT-0126]|nr:hypothetical protein BKA64DRAFT_708562 [Leotiomycetes sp. MPI-SDFR-AT-0126]
MARLNNLQVPARDAPTKGGSAGTDTSQALVSTTNVGSPLKNGWAKVTNFIGSLVTERTGNEESADGKKHAFKEPAHQEQETRTPATPNLRKRPAPRDIYRISASPDDGNDGEQESRANIPRKRAKTTLKAKSAILPPKRSLRNNTGDPAKPVHGEPTRKTEPIRRTEPARKTRSNNAGVSTPASSPFKATSDGSLRSIVKRPRGRPRKYPSARPKKIATSTTVLESVIPRNGSVAEVYEASDANSSEEEQEEQPREENEEDEDEDEEDAAQEELEEREDDGLSAILMNPSPVKPIPPTIFRQVSKVASKARGRNADGGAEYEEAEILENGELQKKPFGEGDTEDENEDLLIEDGLFDTMVDIADRVGYHYNKESRSWAKKSSPIVRSSNGKRLMRRAKAILQAYERLRDFMGSENVEASEKAKEELADLVGKLQSECDAILTERLGNPALGKKFFDISPTQAILQDLYFHIIPSLVKILKLATEVYPPKRSIGQTPLSHLYRIITMLADLANTALIQPKDHQPTQQSKSDTWNVSKPTSLLKPHIEKIKKAVSKEFFGRKLAQKAVASEKFRLKWARRAEEQGRRKDMEYRRQRKEIRRRQREAYEQLVSQPFMSRLLKNKLEARRAYAPAQDADTAEHAETNGEAQNIDYDQDFPIEDDPFAEEGEGEGVDDDGPRLSLFGTNNTNDSTHSKPLSEEEKGMFVECMMFEHGDDRYVKAAETLERSMEEIFAFAQDLQEAMDRKHEQGQFNGPQDEWTYDIWVVQQ